ncbi:MFS transporter [Bordetella hinzii]|uniref:MFS transporter n=2 Tax=Bordetella hinzii TaxID=103855 RepID=A0AAN1S0P2_9BORD|nr:MFS transporter [Bordetella hinzii]AKQ55529.1 Multidrug resistance protein MdtH [Bordetella hinzii]AKQ60031.1 Multidrug resistance protein MdtH [Bordetella hinzii]AZW18877.1 MFS transporter [Bordetella hinzii]KCB24169.1 transporter, major facilitator family protein [Bordetella hinzii OH87 BAL007II]KCB24683.1 transporter, major facilitator family protein [Bordetella hinzii L60]
MSHPDSFNLKQIAIPAFGPSLLYGISNGAILPVIALTARDQGASVATAGLIAALIGVGSLLSNIPSALITERFGEKRAMAGAALVSVIGLLLVIGVPRLWVLALAMLMQGCAQSVFQLARQSYMIEVVPLAYRARALSTLGGTTRIGTFIGPFAGAALIHFLGLDGAYWVAICAMLGAGLIAIKAPDIGPAGVPGAPRARMGDVARDHRGVYATLGVGVMLLSALRASRQVVIPLWADHLGLDATTTSLIYGLVAAIDMSVFYPAGKVMDQRGRLWVALPSTLLMGLSLMAIPLTGGAVSFVLVSVMLGFGNGIGSGIVMTLGADAAPAGARTQFLGIWRFMADLGSSGGPVALSALTALVSLGGASFGVGALGLVAAGVFWRWLPRSAPRRA